MLKGKRFTCDYCKRPINTSIVIEVDSVDRECKTTGENILYFHLASDRKAGHYNEGGCYKQWVMSDELFNPHSVRPVLKQEVLEKLAENN